MCGIAGFVTFAEGTDLNLATRTVEFMADALRHRGPDDDGCWVDETSGIALGHRRLSVIDLSPLGHQPMTSRSGHHVIVYNGEIYNFRSLRVELENRGHQFRGHSDTEVILEAISEWGLEAAIRRFNGMFAFALWDRVGHSLTLVRDRFGEKPLYYGWFDGTFVFASELKALRRHPKVRSEVDRDALGMFMRHGYVPAPRSIYRNIYKLLPGTLLRIRRDRHMPDTAPVPYWSTVHAVLEATESPFAGSEEEALAALRSQLEDAVRLRLEVDVPLGAFLSGGVDSSTIVAIMQKYAARPVKTYTVGFEDDAYDEAANARKVAEYLSTQHTEIRVSPRESLDVVPRLPFIYDEPFADSSQIPTYLIASLARSCVTVSLSGDGGDELLGGYNRYLLATSVSQGLLRRSPALQRLIGRALTWVSPKRWDGLAQIAGTLFRSRRLPRHIGDKVHRLGRVLTRPDNGDAYGAFMKVWDQPSAVVLGATDDPADDLQLPTDALALDDTTRMMLLDAVTYLPDDILVKVDRASMAVSLEARVPFLDHRLAQFCWSLPASFKVRKGNLKRILRKLLHSYVPRELVDRPKTGFAVPIANWLRGPLKDWAADLIAPGRLRAQGLLDAATVDNVWQRHLAEQENWQDRLWCVLMFQSWLEAQKSNVESPA